MMDWVALMRRIVTLTKGVLLSWTILEYSSQRTLQPFWDPGNDSSNQAYNDTH